LPWRVSEAAGGAGASSVAGNCVAGGVEVATGGGASFAAPASTATAAASPSCGSVAVAFAFLYIRSRTASFDRALRNLQRLTARHRHVATEVRDLEHDPLRPDESPIVMTPALVRTWPPPRKVLLGELEDRERLLSMLETGGQTSPPNPTIAAGDDLDDPAHDDRSSTAGVGAATFDPVQAP